MSDLQYPIGRYVARTKFTDASRRAAILAIAEAPARLRTAVQGLDDSQLDTPYRPGGWTVRQVVHHVADSHLNAYIRFKLGLTEAEPRIKPYDETRWAELPDSSGPVAVSLDLLAALHTRWVSLLERTAGPDFGRTLFHPELGVVRLDDLLEQYAWHGRHHVAQIAAHRRRMGWR
ncbi:MAG: bacillithiol transferase BstA [Gemmatimonadota bacterium]|jgi:uncharacterized damage-inducible protein DinB|nr:bacillithiol transferase BstA [Gemmatimonadota bacterium]